ncbi:MAG: TIGR00730 family Rossman fold protein [Opitutales bacterium]|nr:TIGR00730 family Rossman fold protein [Opitutales bacterium]
MAKIKRVCVFCGSKPGRNPAYAAAARELGAGIAKIGAELVYGAGNCGLMGIVADSVLESGGSAVGVIPKGFPERVLHKGITRVVFARDMAERKLLMESLADVFIALPGGIGTLDEIFQPVALWQLGFMKKPSGFLNVANYYDTLFEFLRRAKDEGFLPAETLDSVAVSDSPSGLLDTLARKL